MGKGNLAYGSLTYESRLRSAITFPMKHTVMWHSLLQAWRKTCPWQRGCLVAPCPGLVAGLKNQEKFKEQLVAMSLYYKYLLHWAHPGTAVTAGGTWCPAGPCCYDTRSCQGTGWLHLQWWCPPPWDPSEKRLERRLLPPETGGLDG